MLGSKLFAANFCCAEHFVNEVTGNLLSMDIPNSCKSCNFSTRLLPSADLSNDPADKIEFKFDFSERDDVITSCSKHADCRKWHNSNCKSAAGKKKACPGYTKSETTKIHVPGVSNIFEIIKSLRQMNGNPSDKQATVDLNTQLWEDIYTNLNQNPNARSAYSYHPDPHTFKIKYQKELGATRLPTETAPTKISGNNVFAVNLCCLEHFVNEVTGNILIMDIMSSYKSCNFSTRLLPRASDELSDKIEFKFGFSEEENTLAGCSKHADCQKWNNSNCESASGNRKACPGYTKSEAGKILVKGFSSMLDFVRPMREMNVNSTDKHTAFRLNDELWESVYKKLSPHAQPPSFYSYQPDPNTFKIKFQAQGPAGLGLSS